MSQPQIHFVISAPRSGSTWLSRALNHHPEIFATEHRLFGDFCEIWQNNDGSTAPRITSDKYAQAFAMHYFYDQMDMNYGQFVEVFEKSFINFLLSFGARRSGKSVIVDKITPYPGTSELVVKKIRKLLPDAKIIQLVRDGRDVLTSGTFDWLLKDAHGSDRFRYFVDREPGMVLDRFFDDAVIEKWANNWRETIDVFDQQSDLPHTKVEFEQMKLNQPRELERIFATLGVEASPELALDCAEKVTFEKTTGRTAGKEVATAKARKGIAGDWRNYMTATDGKLFHEIAGERLVELGYATDPNWAEQLPEKLSLQPMTQQP